MKLIQKLRVFKRLRNQEELIRKLERQLEDENTPVFYIENYSPGDDGSRSDESIPLWTGNEPSFSKVTLQDKLDIASELIVEGESALHDLLIVLYTSRGIFRKRLGYSGSIDVHHTDDELCAVANFPSIEVGKDVMIYHVFLASRGIELAEVPGFRNMCLGKGDALNVEYRFNAP